MLDVVVIGGGPAGAALAARLAQAGADVAVLERSAYPRPKVCGEFLAAPGVRELDALGLPQAALRASEMRRVALWAGESDLQAPLVLARALAREVLDTLLLEQARRAGARVYQPARAIAVERTGRGMFKVVALPRLELSTRAVVAAHGSWEPGGLATQCTRSPPARRDLFGFKAHFARHGVPAGTVALVPFAGGYAGALALQDGRATFACSVERGVLQAIRRQHAGLAAGDALFRHALASSAALREAFAGSVREQAWLAAGPLRPGARPVVRDGIFTIGNAAGEVHPIVGEGITLALQSAAALARPLTEALARGGDCAEAVPQYGRQHRALFRRRLWRSSVLAALATHPLLARSAREGLRYAPSLLALAARG
ncbi:MAG: NAD(P)/FAD-dependent oxidoreductase [Burkholderiales bacterium]